jgi:tetratricopeptide (TPR) repeat protein
VERLVGRYDQAIASFRSARQRSADPSPVFGARLQRKIGTALRIQGNFTEATAAFDSAMATLSDQHDVEAARIGLEIGQLHWRTGQYAAAREALAQAVHLASSLGEDAVVAKGLQQLGNVPLHAGDPREAVELLNRSRAIFERLEDLPGIAAVRLNLGVAYGRMGRWDECLAELTASMQVHGRIGDLWHIALIHNNIGELHRSRGNHLEAIAAYRQAVSISNEIGDAPGTANALTGLGMARVEAGQIEQGRADLLDAEARFAVLGRSMHLPDIHRSLAAAELASGNLAAAAQAAERSLQFARAANAPHKEAITQRVLAQIALACGEASEARRRREASRRILAEVGEAAELARTDELLQSLPPA